LCKLPASSCQLPASSSVSSFQPALREYEFAGESKVPVRVAPSLFAAEQTVAGLLDGVAFREMSPCSLQCDSRQDEAAVEGRSAGRAHDRNRPNHRQRSNSGPEEPWTSCRELQLAILDESARKYSP
jgi:hypothetical protein